jgi:hypothetical protein
MNTLNYLITVFIVTTAVAGLGYAQTQGVPVQGAINPIQPVAGLPAPVQMPPQVAANLHGALNYLVRLNMTGSPSFPEQEVLGLAVTNTTSISLLPEVKPQDLHMVVSGSEAAQTQGFRKIKEVAKAKGIEESVRFELTARLIADPVATMVLNRALGFPVSDPTRFTSLTIPVEIQLETNTGEHPVPVRNLNFTAVPVIESDQWKGFRLYISPSNNGARNKMVQVGSMSIHSEGPEDSDLDKALVIQLRDEELGFALERLIVMRIKNSGDLLKPGHY